MERDKFLKVDVTKTIKYIEIETCSDCTRTCEWCLHGHCEIHRNDKNKLLSTEYIKNILEDLKLIDYHGTIALFSINEPFLDERIRNGSLIALCKKYLSNSVNVVLTTNGDLLTETIVSTIFSAGLDVLNISCYTDRDIDKAVRLTKKTVHKIQILDQRRFMNGEWESNRAGALESKGKMIEYQCCYAPFFRVVIGYDGAIRICPHEMRGVLTMGNIKNDRFIDIITSQSFVELRKKLVIDRRDICPCNICNINGGYEYMLRHLYKKEDAIEIMRYMQNL